MVLRLLESEVDVLVRLLHEQGRQHTGAALIVFVHPVQLYNYSEPEQVLSPVSPVRAELR